MKVNLIKPAPMAPGERMVRLAKLVDEYAVDGLWRWFNNLPGFDEEYVPLLQALRDPEHDAGGHDAFKKLMKYLGDNEEAKGWLCDIDAHHGCDLTAHEEAAFSLGFMVAQRLMGRAR